MYTSSQDFSPLRFIYREPLKYKIKNDMSKISIGLLLAYLFITAVSFACIFDIDSFLDVGSEKTTSLTYILNGIALLIALPISAAIICKMTSVRLSDCIVIKRISAKKTFFLVMGGLGICMLANYMVELLGYVLNYFGISMSAESLESSMTVNSPLALAVMIVSVAVVPALAEEFMFRGVILTVLRRYGDTFGIFMSALLFGFLHGNFIQTPFAFVVGLVLGYVTVYTGSMLPAMIIHFANNAVSVLMSYLYGNIPFENLVTIIYLFISVLFAIIGVACIAALSKRDKNMLNVSSPDDELTFGGRIKAAVFEPWTAVFIAIMIVLSIFMIVGVQVVQ